MENVKRIRLDARMEAHLEWVAERGVAQRYVAQGNKLEWDIELGLYSCLHFPLHNETQYLSLKLALEHFCDTLWNEFEEHTKAVCLYRGDADFSPTFHWDDTQIKSLQKWMEEGFVDIDTLQKEVNIRVSNFSDLHPSHFLNTEEGHQLIRLFCAQVMSEYMVMLSGSLPEALTPSVELDATNVSDAIHRAQLLSKERYPHFAFSEENLANVGVCMLPLTCYRPSQYKELRTAVQELQKREIPFKFVPESMLTTEWDGLDYLIVNPAVVTPLAKRMLQGFCAAGGTVVSLREPLNLKEEISFSSYINM